MSTSVPVIISALPARMKNGTPSQRQFSTRSFKATNVSVVESGRTSGTSR